ncbi:MAG: glucose/galactose MFS transporter, partial [Bacteroidetes bacterium]|nr:glucose/galactose MFS transporter [Bacteroidota bacterium]
MNQQKSYRSSFILLTTLFFLWGFITVLVDSLIPRLRELFTLSYFQAGLVQFAFFGAYFLLSIPASYILTKIGYKRGIIFGLLTMALGCLLFYPAASYRMFSVFLLAYFILAGGMTILQVAANPFVAVLGS